MYYLATEYLHGTNAVAQNTDAAIAINSMTAAVLTFVYFFMVDLLIFDTVTTTVYHTVRHNSTSAAVLAREILSQIIVPSRFFLTADKIPTKIR